MTRLLIFVTILIAFSVPSRTLSVTPVRAQDSSADPAAYLPARAALYLEFRADDAALAAFDQQINRLSALSGVPAPSQIGFADLLTGIFFGGDFRADVLPWLADRFALAMVAPPSIVSPQATDFAFVLPIADAAGAQAFVDRMSARAAERDVLPDGTIFYFGGTFSMAANDQVIWFGAPNAVRLMMETSAGTLAQNPAYQHVRAALPADALVSGYLSGKYFGETVALTDWYRAPDAPRIWTIWEAALRLHPAQSAMEDALLQFPALNGVGFAVQTSDPFLNITGVLSLDAAYPAPTLATATAGAALLDVIPGDSFAVFASYDLSLVSLPVVGLGLLGPAVGNVFSSIVASLDGTPPPTPTPTPTPTPAPPLTADAIIAQVQPFIAQAESLMGMSLDELYSLTNGEYAVAVFPGAGPTIGAALYLQTSDPQRLLDTLDHVSRLILTDPTNGTPLVAVEHQTIDGVDVSLLGTPGAGDRPALGILGENVLFLTMESAVPKVIASASGQSFPSPAIGYRGELGSGQDAFLYLDPRTIDLYAMGRQRIPPLPITAIASWFDIRDDGLFILSLTAALSDQ